jgi:flagellar basal-body rod protein FlgF
MKTLAPGIYTLIEGSLYQELRFEAISNNLANVNTNAFKRDQVAFDEVFAEVRSSTDFSPGPGRHTGNELDVTLNGPGFFMVQTPEGVRYTRDGSFTLNGEGDLVTQNEDIVLGQNGAIPIENGHVTIDKAGNVMVENETVGKISVVEFQNRELLKKEGHSYYRYDGDEEDIINMDEVGLEQGYLEQSNVNPTEEMIQMIEAFRAYESVQKAIQSMDELTNQLVTDAGVMA